MGDLVTLSLKLCNSNCLDSRCTGKNDPLFEDSEDMQSIFTKGHMKSSLDGKPSTFSDSSFGTVYLFFFVDWWTAPHGQIWLLHVLLIAKRGVLSSLWHGYAFWRARCRFWNRGLVTILVHLYLYNLHHNSSRITRFLLRLCVSIQWHTWRFTLFILFWSLNANVTFPRFYVSICDGPCDLLHVVLLERRQNQVGSFNWSDCKMAVLRAFQCTYDWWVGSREEC